MADSMNPTSKKTLDPLARNHDAGMDKKSRGHDDRDNFSENFERLKRSVIQPAFETIGNNLKEHGHEINISEEPGGQISIHIVPAGAKKSIHPYNWFPTFSIFGAPFSGSVGMHGRNMRPNSEVSSGSRGDYKLAQVSPSIVEKELMKFIGEIANW